MGAEDWEINVLVKSVLVKRWVDIRRFQISTTQGIVHLKGMVGFKGMGIVEDHQPFQLLQIEKDIKAIKGVRGVKMDLFNWKKNRITGSWEKKMKEVHKSKQ